MQNTRSRNCDWERHLLPDTPRGTGGIAYLLAQIILKDRELKALRDAKDIYTLSDLNEARRLRAERKLFVRAIQNYRPQGATL
jgi:hypothetical protein